MTGRGTPVIYFESLNRSNLWLGIDPKLFLVILGLSGGIAISAQFHPLMLGVALLFFMITFWLVREACKADNQILQVYRTHIHYQKYYAPCAGIHAKSRLVKPSVPAIKNEGGIV